MNHPQQICPPFVGIKEGMEGETVTLINSSQRKKSVDAISILVVDDDTTCLSIVTNLLKKFRYQVVAVKHPNDALCTLRSKDGAFDLVVSDVYMPDMNGFELQQAVAQEFNLPVVLMSGDDKEGTALKGLESGAAFFILKPVSLDDLRGLWQFAAMKKKSTRVVIEESGADDHQKISPESDETIANSASSVNEDTAVPNCNKKETKRKSLRKEGSDEKKTENNAQSSSQKRPKVIWTNSLHNRFLDAIRSIGLDRAVPKKILEVMNVPGLTRENVASHLQKYRIFLRRVSDASYKIQYSADKAGLSRSLRPPFDPSRTSPSALLLSRLATQRCQNLPGRQFPGSSAANLLPVLPNPEASSGSLVTQSGFGQSRLLCNKGGWVKPNIIGNTNLVQHNDRPFARLGQNIYQPAGSSFQGQASNITAEDLSSALSASFGAPLVGSPRMNPGAGYEVQSMGNIGALNAASPAPKCRTNYVGYSLSNLKQLAELKHGVKSNGEKNPCGDHSNRTAIAGALSSGGINVDQLVQHVGGSPNSLMADNGGGVLLSNVIADYQTLLLPEENGGKRVYKSHEAFSLFDDLSELAYLSTPQGLKGGDFDNNFADQANIQNQAQKNGEERIASSSFFGGVSLRNNLAPSFDQALNQQQFSQGVVATQGFGTSSQLNTSALVPATQNVTQQQVHQGLTNYLEYGSSASHQFNKTLQSPPPPAERDDDDFLDSLLAPFGEQDQIVEGI